MVFFVCSACGQALKKNQVEKHYMHQCRNCEVLTCMDCNKEFWGNDYVNHTSCVSEDQKYGGKDYKPKPSQNKGLKKQMMWTEVIKESAATAKASPMVKNLVERLTEFTNIPRKKGKFENFAKSSLKLWDQKIIDQIWQIFSQAHEQVANGNCKSEGQTSKRKVDIDLQDGDSVALPIKKVKTSEETEDDSNSLKKPKFKWTKTLKTILREREDHCLSMKKVKKKMVKEYESFLNGSVDFDKEEFLNSLQERITNCKKFEIDDEYVKFIERTE